MRIVILGGPRTGKTTLARKLGWQSFAGDGPESADVRHTDDLIEPMANLGREAWSAASAAVAKWLDEPGPWIIEGVAVARALRKWREAHPGTRPPVDRVIRLTTPHVALNKGQAAMAKGEASMWAAIEDWILDSGVTVDYQMGAAA